jgi:hypothetical protein
VRSSNIPKGFVTPRLVGPEGIVGNTEEADNAPGWEPLSCVTQALCQKLRNLYATLQSGSPPGVVFIPGLPDVASRSLDDWAKSGALGVNKQSLCSFTSEQSH